MKILQVIIYLIISTFICYQIYCDLVGYLMINNNQKFFILFLSLITSLLMFILYKLIKFYIKKIKI
jgi:hypothetical protein